jgi:hypothetical protein
VGIPREILGTHAEPLLVYAICVKRIAVDYCAYSNYRMVVLYLLFVLQGQGIVFGGDYDLLAKMVVKVHIPTEIKIVCFIGYTRTHINSFFVSMCDFGKTFSLYTHLF